MGEVSLRSAAWKITSKAQQPSLVGLRLQRPASASTRLTIMSKEGCLGFNVDDIAGAGFAGLAAANRLASKGIPVTVYDMGSRGPGDTSLAAKLCCPCFKGRSWAVPAAPEKEG